MPRALILNSLLPTKLPTKRKGFKISLKNFLIFSFLLVLILLAFYIFQITILASQNYQVQSSNKTLNQLSKENEVLEINLSRNNSLENLEPKIKELGFEKIDKVRFLQILEGQIVTK